MASDAFEATLGISFDDSSEELKAIKATGGKPSRLFPYLIEDFSLFGYFGPDLYKYTGKYYEPFTDFDIDRYIRKFYLYNELADKYNQSKARELKAMIKFDPNIVKDDFDNYDYLVNLNSGIYNYDTKELIPHSHKYKFTYALDVDYDPKKDSGDCPIFKKFLQGCFAKRGTWEGGFDYDEDTYENILRLCGYLLYPVNRKEGLFIFLGEGSNGKSVLMDTLQLFFPAKYITRLSLNAISNGEGFTREGLIRSRVNFCSEAKGGQIDSEELKKVASGEGITIQRKHTSAMEMISRCKVVVNANNAPYFNDTTHGILRRLFFFNFKNRFMPVKDYEAEKDQEARGIYRQIDKKWLEDHIKEEKTAIFKMFLDALDRFRKDDWQFVKSQNMEEIFEDYKEGADTLGTWLSEHYELGVVGVDFISVDDIYNRFRIWYDDNFSKKYGYSSLAVARKIKERFRIPNATRQYVDKFEHDADGFLVKKKVKATGYPLIEKRDVEAFEKLRDSAFAETKQDQLL